MMRKLLVVLKEIAIFAELIGKYVGAIGEAVLHRHGFDASDRHLQNCFVATRAPSAIAANLAQTTSGSTAAWPTQVP